MVGVFTYSTPTILGQITYKSLLTIKKLNFEPEMFMSLDDVYERTPL